MLTNFPKNSKKKKRKMLRHTFVKIENFGKLPAKYIKKCKNFGICAVMFFKKLQTTKN